MNIKDSKKLMNLAMKANVPYLMVGHSGLGKSQITEQIAKEIFPTHKFVAIFASQADVGDFIGIPDIVKLETTNTDGKKAVSRVTSWARPEWMPYEPCVLFLDELNNARPDVESAMLQLVLEKRIHTHELHPDSYICAAINPATAEYTTANTMSAALVKRFIVIPFEPQATEFLTWAKDSKRVNPKLVSFLQHQPNITGVEKKLDTLIDVKPCPRLWTEAASKMYDVMEKEGLTEDRELIKDMLSSTVGGNAAAAFLSWMDTQDKPLTFKEIIEDPDAAVIKLNEFIGAMRTDLVSSTVENVITGFKEVHEKLVTKIKYKVSILEFDRGADQKLVAEAVKELNDNVKNNLGTYKGKLDNLIKFLSTVPNDVMYQVSHALITNKPFKEQNGESDKAYHEDQVKRFDAYNTMIFYLYREDLIPGHKGINARFIESTQEVAKHKKKANEG